jgi:type III secretion protein C
MSKDLSREVASQSWHTPGPTGRAARAGTHVIAGLFVIATALSGTAYGQDARDLPDSLAPPIAASESIASSGSSSGLLPAASDVSQPPTFVANNTSLSDVFNAIKGKLARPIVVSAKTRALFVTGTFDLTSPMSTLKKLAQTMGLMTFDDGRSIFVYRDNEVTGSVVQMGHQRLGQVRTFLRASHLYDEQYPITGADSAAVFYVSGPPIYVRLVVAAADYLDKLPGAQNDSARVLRVVPLHNTFVVNRRYMVRGKLVTVPGVADVIHALFSSGGAASAHAAGSSTNAFSQGDDKAPDNLLSLPLPKTAGAATSSPDLHTASGQAQTVAMTDSTAWDVRMVPNPDSNSILLYGPSEHVDLMERAIEAIDVAKRQIELSLWIIDVDRQKLNELGINWQSSATVGPISASANGTPMTSLNGIKFLATINALSERGKATIVSRPIVLTEENVPAIFDNNHTEYYPLVGERTAALEQFTYGTLVSVLPRLTRDAKEVEMIVTVQDGRAQDSGSTAKNTPVIPVVSDTQISTVARVPQHKSLLLGGSTIDQHETTTYYIPGLWKIPYLGKLFRLDRKRTEHMVRLFLIQPRVLKRQDGWLDGQTLEAGDLNERSRMAATSEMLQQYMEDVSGADK